MRTIDHWINGALVPSASGRTSPVYNPATGEVQAEVGLASIAEVDLAVANAKETFATWRLTSLSKRSEIMFAFRQLLVENRAKIADLVSIEHGKVPSDAAGELARGLENIEFACGIPSLLKGGYSEQVSGGVDVYSIKQPLGVVAGITPFNFPAMVPMWMYPIALALGNCFILKPSEKVPLTSQLIARLTKDAGFPPGVFSLLNGTREAVESLIDHEHVKAVGFVGSSPLALDVYRRATALGKRALCLGGAKNHLIVVPDADEAITVRGVLDSFTGCAGQRCMAASMMIAVGDADNLIEKICDAAVAHAAAVGTAMGAIIDKGALERIRRHVDDAEKSGAKIIVDGRNVKSPKTSTPLNQDFTQGNWFGPTIIDHAKPDMACAREEIFGPVLTIVRVKTLAEALAIENANPFGNATSVFTTNGAVARHVADHATSGMIGINIGVPVPREPFSFGGTKISKYGQGDITGESSLDLWSNLKKVTTKWSLQSDASWMS